MSSSVVREKRIELAKRYASHITQKSIGTVSSQDGSATQRQRERICWLCGQDVGSVIYDKKDLCLDCAEDFLRYGLLPQLDSVFTAADHKIEQIIVESESRTQAMTSPLSSPLNRDLPGSNGAPSGWTCHKCKSIQSDHAQRCACCATRRPPDPQCPRCGENVLLVAMCASVKKHHKPWSCNECSTLNIEEAVECRACHKHRTWFCAACSLENPWLHRFCDACEGSNKLESLSTLVNREFLTQLGLGAEAASMHRDQQKKVEQVKEHTSRLERRIDQMGLLPIPIDDDGNCLFRALSYQLVRTDIFHSVVRHAVADYMEAHHDEYALLVGGDEIEAYVSGMRRHGVWGDELCVHAASRAFGIPIHVVTSEESRWHLRYDPITARTANFALLPVERQLFLSYRSPDHYYCLVLESEEQNIHVRTIDLDASLRHWGGSVIFKAVATRPLELPAPSRIPVAQLPSATSVPAPARSGLPSVSQNLTALIGGQPPGHVHVELKPPVTNIATPPPLRRGGADPPAFSSLPPSSSQAAASAAAPPSSLAIPSVGSTRVGGSAPPSGPALLERPMTRSLRNEVLQYSHLNLLQHPIMVQLFVASSTLNIGVGKDDMVRQEREGSYFYLYTVPHNVILDGGDRRFPWGPLYRQTRDLCDDIRRQGPSHHRQLMPLFLLQHVANGGFLCPGEDVSLKRVFTDLEPVRRAELTCFRTNQLASCLLTVDDVSTQSRSKLYLKFYKKDLPAPFIGFVGDKPLFCCELPVAQSMLVMHQLFSGNPERLCLRCRQWYDGSRSALWRKYAASDTCPHFSWVDETMEEMSRY